MACKASASDACIPSLITDFTYFDRYVREAPLLSATAMLAMQS